MKNLIKIGIDFLVRKKDFKEVEIPSISKEVSSGIDRTTIFPDISFKESFDQDERKYKYTFTTNVRKLHTDGKYYLSHITQGFEFFQEGSMNRYKQKSIQNFMCRSYIFYHIGIIDCNYIMTFCGEPASILDRNQSNEIDRLTNIVKNNQ